jgi:hypothetical protein
MFELKGMVRSSRKFRRDPMPPAEGQSAGSSRPPLGLKTIIVIAFGLLLAGAVATVSAIAQRSLVSATRAHVESELSSLAFQMRYRLDRSMHERYRDLLIASSLDALSAGSAAERRRVLERLQQTYPDYAWLGLTDSDGVVVASAGRLLEGVDVSSRAWFTGALDGPYVGDVHDAALLQVAAPRWLAAKCGWSTLPPLCLMSTDAG